ncbi:MAG: N-methyl-L-tryptophan oxidase [Verrucomicrobiota bacterium]|nr:N-methyl-L-tryptophan oxidase [Verrucomicrobiota bacterium]
MKRTDPHLDAIVIGLGAAGSGTLYQLAKRGMRALGIDQFAPPHDRGSSHGETRITRLALGEGKAYAPLVKRSHEIWLALEKATGASLLHQVGGLIFSGNQERTSSHGAPDFLKTTQEVAVRHHIRHEMMDATQLEKRFPQFKFRGDETGYYEPDAGYLRPEACIRASLGEAQRMGARIACHETFQAWERDGQGIKVLTSKGTYFTEKLVLTVGPWIGSLLPELALCATPYRQVLFWFEADGPEKRFRPGNMPVFIQAPDAHHTMFYGFPEIGGTGSGLKIAGEQYDRQCHPDRFETHVTQEEIDAMFRAASPHLHIRPKCIKATACHYTVTPDFDFLIDRHAEDPAVWFASPCSGHGFKHSAAVGQALSECLSGDDNTFDLSAFKRNRF